MEKNDVKFFCCLKCKEDLLLETFEADRSTAENVNEGVLFCQSCKIFYPIAEGVPFLLDSGYYVEYFDT